MNRAGRSDDPTIAGPDAAGAREKVTKCFAPMRRERRAQHEGGGLRRLPPFFFVHVLPSVGGSLGTWRDSARQSAFDRAFPITREPAQWLRPQSTVVRNPSTTLRNASGSSTCGMWLDSSKSSQ